MSGFEVFNNDGATVINSDQIHTLFDSIRTPGIGHTGDLDESTTFGNLNQLGFISPISNSRVDGYLHWIQFTTNGGWAFPGPGLFKPGTFRVIRTSRNKNPVSGYLDVFDSSGKLIWSAQSATTMPRVVGYVDIPSSYNLEANIFSISPGFNPFFLWDAVAGTVDIPEEAQSSFSGSLVRWTGSQLQFHWIRRNCMSFSALFSGRGNFRIPYARFQGYN